MQDSSDSGQPAGKPAVRTEQEAEEAAAQLLQEEQAAAEAAQQAQQREAAKRDKKARQKQRKQVQKVMVTMVTMWCCCEQAASMSPVTEQALLPGYCLTTTPSHTGCMTVH